MTIRCYDCKKKTEMECIEKHENSNIIVLRCLACKNTQSYLVEQFFKSDAVKSKKIRNSKKAKRLKKYTKIEKYEPEKSYRVGQLIYHTIFEDVGKIIKRSDTDAGNKKMVVSFERVGEKVLIEGMSR